MYGSPGALAAASDGESRHTARALLGGEMLDSEEVGMGPSGASMMGGGPDALEVGSGTTGQANWVAVLFGLGGLMLFAYLVITLAKAAGQNLAPTGENME